MFQREILWPLSHWLSQKQVSRPDFSPIICSHISSCPSRHLFPQQYSHHLKLKDFKFIFPSLYIHTIRFKMKSHSHIISNSIQINSSHSPISSLKMTPSHDIQTSFSLATNLCQFEVPPTWPSVSHFLMLITYLSED